MAEAKKRGMRWAVLCALALAFVATAAGASYWRAYQMTVRGVTHSCSFADWTEPVYSDNVKRDRLLKIFFAPANKIDRKLHPDAWPEWNRERGRPTLH